MLISNYSEFSLVRTEGSNLLGDYFQILQIEVDKGSISIDLYMTDIILITWNFSSLFRV